MVASFFCFPVNDKPKTGGLLKTHPSPGEGVRSTPEATTFSETVLAVECLACKDEPHAQVDSGNLMG